MNTTLIPCQCHCHVLLVEDFHDEIPEIYLAVLGGNQRSLANRLRGAWKLLRGDYECVHEVALDTAGIHQLATVLDNAEEALRDNCN